MGEKDANANPYEILSKPVILVIDIISAQRRIKQALGYIFVN